MRRGGFRGALGMDLRRAFGPQFWLCVVLVAGLHIHANSVSFGGGFSLVYMYNEAVTIEDYMQNLNLILISTVFSTAFLDDFHSEFYRFQLMRCSRAQYLAAKLSACALSAFLCMWLGNALYLLAMRTSAPLVLSEDIARSYVDAYALNGCALLQEGRPVAYLLTAVTLRSIAMIFWPLCAMAISAYVPNRFVVLGMPWLLMYAIGMAESLMGVPYGRRFSEFTSGGATFVMPGTALAQLLIRYLPCIAVCAAGFCIGAERRLKNG